MSVLVVGMSHQSAPVDVLERAALDTDGATKLAHAVLDNPHITESVVISTCNRVELYVDTDRFHGSVEDATAQLAQHTTLSRDEFVRHVYVHYDDAAVAHLFEVASGLDSMILGESQILGQVRESLHTAQAESTVGTALNSLFQQALRVGKRGHAETGIDRLGPSIVTAAFEAGLGDIADSRFLVAGAGTMANLAVRTLVDRGVDPARIWVANRTFQRAFDLVATFGVSAVRWESLDVELAGADVLITCTGATGTVFDAERISRATNRGDRALTVIDLALPRDVAHDVRDLPGVSVVDLEVLAVRHADTALSEDIAQVREIVKQELESFAAAKAAATVTPTVVALRSMATEVVGAEFERLMAKLPDVDDATAREIRRGLHRVAEKLIHAPTVRVKELSAEPEGLTYATALANLFALDPSTIEAVSSPRGAR